MASCSDSEGFEERLWLAPADVADNCVVGSPSDESPSNACPKCGENAMEQDECASEVMIVCLECGHIIEAGSLDLRKTSNSSQRESFSKQRAVRPTKGGHLNNRLSMAFQAELSDVPKCRKNKKSVIEKHIIEIADKMKIPEHQRTVCVDAIDEILELESLSSWKGNDVIAASLVFLLASNRSPRDFSNLRTCIDCSARSLRNKIKLVKALPSFKSHEANITQRIFKKWAKPDVKLRLQESLDELKFDLSSKEKQDCLQLAFKLWNVFLDTSIGHYLECGHLHVVCALLVLTYECCRKTKLKDLEKFCRPLNISLQTLRVWMSKMKATLVQLSKEIPSLEDYQSKLSTSTITKYLRTIVENHAYLSSLKRTSSSNEDNPEGQSSVTKKKKEVPIKEGEPCVPLEFSCPQDDSLSLQELDVDEYLATKTEIEEKTKLLNQLSS